MLPETVASKILPSVPLIAPKLPNDNVDIPSVTLLKDSTVNTPDPEISAPVKENPITVPAPSDTTKPTSPAAPPDADEPDRRSTSNLYPATALPKSDKTSTLPQASNSPNDKKSTQKVN